MSSLDDLTGGLIGGNGLMVKGLITIAGKSYVQTDEGMREATPEEIAANEERKATKAAAKAAAKTQAKEVGGTPTSAPSVVFGDIAGRDIIKTSFHFRDRSPGDDEA